MGKMKNVIFDLDAQNEIWVREWEADHIGFAVGDWCLTEEGNICEYFQYDRGFMKLVCIVSDYEQDLGRIYMYQMSRLIKVPKGCTLLAAKALYGRF